MYNKAILDYAQLKDVAYNEEKLLFNTLVLKEAISKLEPEEKLIIKFYLMGYDLHEIGRLMGFNYLDIKYYFKIIIAKLRENVKLVDICKKI
ncbi:MAG: hypothetical protein NC921_03990 [Candidatus Omnitrophica bacterium]|nr:hypothetical protein [Candidatus Omnitrophota bacterium]